MTHNPDEVRRVKWRVGLLRTKTRPGVVSVVVPYQPPKTGRQLWEFDLVGTRGPDGGCPTTH